MGAILERRMTMTEVNAQLQAEAEGRLAYYAQHPREIDGRMRELDKEWDLERAIELDAAATVLTGFFLGATVSKKWFLLSLFASAMLLLRNSRREWPTLPILRRLGLRTSREIARERYALKALRGDFERISRTEGERKTRLAFDAADPAGSATEGPGQPHGRKGENYEATKHNQETDNNSHTAKHRAGRARTDSSKH